MDQEAARSRIAQLEGQVSEQESASAVLNTRLQHSRENMERVRGELSDQDSRGADLEEQTAQQRRRLEEIAGRRGATFSFVALAPGTVVSEDGMEWELDHKPCELLGDLGVSNVVRAERARFTCHAGCAVAYVFA